jgi:hypothetical protein
LSSTIRRLGIGARNIGPRIRHSLIGNLRSTAPGSRRHQRLHRTRSRSRIRDLLTGSLRSTTPRPRRNQRLHRRFTRRTFGWRRNDYTPLIVHGHARWNPIGNGGGNLIVLGSEIKEPTDTSFEGGTDPATLTRGTDLIVRFTSKTLFKSRIECEILDEEAGVVAVWLEDRRGSGSDCDCDR